MPAGNKSNELRITRIYDAPVATVWDAWTDPEQAAHWWGPRGFTITTHSKDLRVGGHWRYTMHGPDGTDYPNWTKYFEVERHAKLVYDHGGNDEQAPLFRVTVLFSETAGKTKMDMRMTLPTAEAAEETRRIVKKMGGDGTWDRLGEYLEKGSSGKDVFFITRSFDAPLEVMFDMWTDPEHIARWVPPTGFTMKFIRADIRTGGGGFYSMSNGAGMTMYGRTEYLKIEKPGLVVYKQQFCDEKENVTRHPMAPLFPEAMLTTVRFAEEGPARTRVTLKWEPFGDATAAEIDVFAKMRTGMTQGWTGSLDKLEEALAGL